MSGTLNDQRDRYGARDQWLSMLLGLISLAMRLGSDVERATRGDGRRGSRPDDEPALAVLLGVVALRERFIARLEGVAPPTSGQQPRNMKPAAIESLLR